MIRSASVAERNQQFEALAAEVGPLAFSVALRMLGNHALAEDAIQNAFLQAYRSLGCFRGESNLKTWFLRILVNCCHRQRRIWYRWLTGTPREPNVSVDEVPSEPTRGDPVLRERLEQAVLRLPHRQCTAFVLRYKHDLGIAEIAEIMDCAQGTVKATLHKAVRRLRRDLADVLEGGEKP